MPLIYLVRHGEHDEVGKTLSGRSEIALNEQGMAEAEALVSLFDDIALSSIHCSPRRRTVQTAMPLSKTHALPVQTTTALDEIDFGQFMGRRFEDLEKDSHWHHWNANRASARCPSGETMQEAVDRANALVLQLARQNETAVCVTHCDVIRGVVAQWLGLPFARIYSLDCAPGSVTALSIQEGDVRLLALNMRARL